MSILEMSLHASAMILFAALLRALALHRLPKRCFVALWLLASARMLLPWKLPFRYGALALLARAFPTLGAGAALPMRSTTIAALNGAALAKGSAVGAAVGSGGTTSGGLGPALSLWQLIWQVGLIACALALLLPHLRWRRIYARSLPTRDANIVAWLHAHPLRLRRVQVRISDEIPTPMTYGLLRPVILLPKSLGTIDPGRLHFVLTHELTHIRRYDLLAKLIIAAALCAHWFNPLAWLMYLLANRDIELACDEAVLLGMDESARRSYARTLLDLAAQQHGLPSPLFNGFGRQTIEERIGEIMNGRKLSKFAALAAMLLVAITALVLATSAEEAEPSQPANPQIEGLMFDGWEDQTLLKYHERIRALVPDTAALLRSVNWNDQRYTDYLRFVFEPLTSGDWRDAALCWIQESSIGTYDASGGEGSGFDLRVRCDVADANALSVGEFRDALRAVLNGMDYINAIALDQDTLDERTAELAAANSSEAIEFQIEATLQKDKPRQEEVATALFFDGWREMSVRDYAAIIADFRELSPAEANELPEDYMKYVYYPLRAGLDAPQSFSGSTIDAASGTPCMNYRMKLTITDRTR